jgi:hypothetical protein
MVSDQFTVFVVISQHFGQPYAPTVRARGRRRLLTAEQEEVFSSAVLE